MIFYVSRKYTGFTTKFPKLNRKHVTGVPEKAIFQSIIVHHYMYITKNDLVNAICLLIEQVQDIYILILSVMFSQLDFAMIFFILFVFIKNVISMDCLNN